jgi:hypothetical protein
MDSALIDLLLWRSMTKRDPKALVTNKTLGQAVDAILNGVERMFDKQNKQINKRFKKVDERFKKVDQKLGRIETDVRDTHRRMIDLEVDTPTRTEFHNLKARVDKYHPLVD